MALTTAQQVRLKIQDQPLRADLTFYGDGSANAFNLPHNNVTAATAYVPGSNGQWSATGAAFDASGFVTFSGVVSANSAWRAVYTHSVFSDDEIGHFTAVGGGVLGAAIQACEALMFDAIKRAEWAAPDGTKYDDTQAMVHLRVMYGRLQQTSEDEAIAGGALTGWGLNQENT